MVWIVYIWTVVLSGYRGAAPYTRGPGAGEPCSCLSEAEASRILGQPVERMESTVAEREGGVERFTCIFTATTEDPKTHKKGNLYYMLEVYADSAAAHKTYTEIVASNVHMPGQHTLANLGREAWEHTDRENFYLVLVRERNMLLRIKINKLTSMTSQKDLQDVVREVARRMKQG
jgi:hypothetical protein